MDWYEAFLIVITLWAPWSILMAAILRKDARDNVEPLTASKAVLSLVALLLAPILLYVAMWQDEVSS